MFDTFKTYTTKNDIAATPSNPIKNITCTALGLISGGNNNITFDNHNIPFSDSKVVNMQIPVTPSISVGPSFIINPNPSSNEYIGGVGVNFIWRPQ